MWAFSIVRIAMARASWCASLRFDLMPYGFAARCPPSARQIAWSSGSIWVSEMAGVTSDAQSHSIAAALPTRAIATRTLRPPRPLGLRPGVALDRTT